MACTLYTSTLKKKQKKRPDETDCQSTSKEKPGKVNSQEAAPVLKNCKRRKAEETEDQSTSKPGKVNSQKAGAAICLNMEGPWADETPESHTSVGCSAATGSLNLYHDCSELLTAKAMNPPTVMTTYARRGSDPEQVKQRLAKCKCRCAKDKEAPGCHQNVNLVELQLLCQAYWSLGDKGRDAALHAVYRAAVGSATSQQPLDVVEWHLCNKKVCFANFCILLGTSNKTIRKQITQSIDLRKSMPGEALCRPRPQSEAIDYFFRELYQSAAEPLPEQKRRGRTHKSIDADISWDDGPWELDTKALAENFEELDGWQPDAPTVQGMVALTVASQAHVVGVPIRYLPHGSMCHLYEMFLSSWDTLRDYLASGRPCGSEVQSSDQAAGGQETQAATEVLRSPPHAVTFWRRWQYWKTYLRFRKSSQHSQCQTCFEIQQALRKHGNTPLQKLTAARDLRQHYKDQYLDRCIYWSHRWCSRYRKTLLCIIIDSMDRAKLAWPKWPWAKMPKQLDGLLRPRVVLTAALAHGWCGTVYLAAESENHGADGFCEVLIRPQFFAIQSTGSYTATQQGMRESIYSQHSQCICHQSGFAPWTRSGTSPKLAMRSSPIWLSSKWITL
jgi:hypothetical protein